MSGFAFDRVAACGGAAFTLLAFSTLAVAPPTPDVDAPATEIRSYLVDEHDRFGISVALMALAVLALCLALGYVWRRLTAGRGADTLTTTFAIAGAVAASMALTGVLLQGVLAQQSTGLDDSTLLALYRTWQVVAFMGPPLPVAIVLALVSVGTLRDGILPRWTGWVALVAAVGGAATALLNLGSDVTAPVVLDLGSFLLTCVWLTAVTVSAFVAKPPLAEPAYVQAAR
jgi:hypothetical protein